MALPEHVAVLGAGTMGNGIIQAFAAHGVATTMIDLDQGALDRGFAAIGKSLARFVKKERITAADAEAILGRVTLKTSLADAKDADLVVEAVTENEAVKCKVFAELDGVCKPSAILASNTSSISITVLGAATSRPEQVIGMHFMNPVPLMKLVEVIRGQDTSDQTTETVLSWSEGLQKIPVAANDYPGFISNRVLMPMINEAAFCLMEGVSTKEGIDEIMKLGMNHPMGPLTLADFIGLDVCVSILDVLKDGLGDDKYRACPLMRRMVAAGHLGRKSGRGFYDYREQ